jgi:hypothetical protein
MFSNGTGSGASVRWVTKHHPTSLNLKENVTPAAGNTVPPVISRVPEIYGPGAMLHRLVAKRKNPEPAEPVSNWGR